MKSEAKGILKHIPNTITSLNLLSGCVASVLAMEGNLIIASILILMATVFDFFDGFSARLLKAYSPMGKELDSLADLISFGLAPSLIAMAFMKQAVLGSSTASISITSLEPSVLFWLISAFLIPVFSALRLAKFNVDTRQTSSFIGVPTPANALFWASLPLVLSWGDYAFVEQWLASPFVLLGFIVATSLLLVAEVPMFSLKIKTLAWQSNQIRYLFLFTLIVLAIAIHWLVVPAILWVYILFSLIENVLRKREQ